MTTVSRFRQLLDQRLAESRLQLERSRKLKEKEAQERLSPRAISAECDSSSDSDSVHTSINTSESEAISPVTAHPPKLSPFIADPPDASDQGLFVPLGPEADNLHNTKQNVIEGIEQTVDGIAEQTKEQIIDEDEKEKSLKVDAEHRTEKSTAKSAKQPTEEIVDQNMKNAEKTERKMQENVKDNKQGKPKEREEGEIPVGDALQPSLPNSSTIKPEPQPVQSDTSPGRPTRPATDTPDVKEPSPKKAKVARRGKESTLCTCAISSSCPRAAANGVRDCRINMRPISKRVKVTESKGTRTTWVLSTRQHAEIARTNNEILDILAVFNRLRHESDPRNIERTASRLRNCVHQAPFLQIPERSLQEIKSKFLNPSNGLPALIHNHRVPWDVRLDVEVYLNRVKSNDLNPDLQRGIKVQRSSPEQREREPCGHVYYKIIPGFEFRIQPLFVGEGHLRNGQWFPLQICAVRDGAHGEMIAGIFGREATGAVSIVLSKGGESADSYANTDEGDTIKYCGTVGKDGKVSYSTALMLETEKKGNSIRVLRGSKLPKMNKYRPAGGLRYDGLYKIVDHEILDKQTVMYRFQLRRLPGQTPIRYTGPEKRPTSLELEELEKIKQHIEITKVPARPRAGMKRPAR